jgi:hypothetical protein
MASVKVPAVSYRIAPRSFVLVRRGRSCITTNPHLALPTFLPSGFRTTFLRPHNRPRQPRAALRTFAMVNVDVSPSVILGVGLIGAGVSLWQIRQAKPWISRDYDVVISCISLLVGGILIFQGWRLDPLLLFGQLMTTGAAVSFAVEALKLRSEVYEEEERAELQDAFQRRYAGPGGGGGRELRLPPPPPGRPFDGEAGEQSDWSAERRWDEQNRASSGGEFYDYNYDQGGAQQFGDDYVYSYAEEDERSQELYGGNAGYTRRGDQGVYEPRDSGGGGDYYVEAEYDASANEEYKNDAFAYRDGDGAISGVSFGDGSAKPGQVEFPPRYGPGGNGDIREPFDAGEDWD